MQKCRKVAFALMATRGRLHWLQQLDPLFFQAAGCSLATFVMGLIASSPWISPTQPHEDNTFIQMFLHCLLIGLKWHVEGICKWLPPLCCVYMCCELNKEAG